MTALAEIIGEAMIYIDDVRLQEQLEVNPALFYRRTSAYVSAAMPLLSSPPELFCHVSKEYVPAEFDDYTWVSTEQSVNETTEVNTGCIGYDLCSVMTHSEDGLEAYPYADYTYDAETGIVTFGIQKEADTEYEIDFYKDGSVRDLTLPMKRLFALAIAVVWDERFSRDWLAVTPKIRDSTFNVVNESTYMDKLTGRTLAFRKKFEDELHKYEQVNAYRNVNRPYHLRRLM